MILSDRDIQKEIAAKTIVIEPFDPKCLGANSYDVHLSKYLAVYDELEIEQVQEDFTFYLDAKKHNQIKHFEIPEQGFIIKPGILYLGSTLEYTETMAHVPFLEGKSSTGRLGINIHATAGKGDVGFCNYWTFELSCIHPVKIYAGMPIAQLIYHEVASPTKSLYVIKENAKYTEKDPRPKESMMFKNFPA